MKPDFRTTALGLGFLAVSLTGACADDGSSDDQTTSGDMSTAAHEPADLGEGDGSDVVTIGDSWMNLDNSVGIQESLEKVSGRDYRNYGVPGTKLLDEVIPMQYEQAKSEGPIQTVIMTAGGNDVLQDFALLLGPCTDAQFDTATDCKARIDEVTARLTSLWDEMAQDGVQDVVIIGYTTQALGGGYSKSVLYSEQQIQPICDMVQEPLRCHAIDTDMEVPDLALRFDTIHPDDASYDAIGQVVWDLMQAEGMRR